MTHAQHAYREYLKSDHWRGLRLEAFKVHGRKCFKCPATCRLDVHHLRYRHPWTDCTVEDVRPCCRGCHEKEHGVVVITIPQVQKVKAQRKKKKPRKPQNRNWQKEWARYSIKQRRKARAAFLRKKDRLGWSF